MPILTIRLYHGAFNEVEGLPPDWFVSIRDNDEGIDDHNPSDKNVVRITIEDGYVNDVENLPDGFTWEEEEIEDDPWDDNSYFS